MAMTALMAVRLVLLAVGAAGSGVVMAGMIVLMMGMRADGRAPLQVSINAGRRPGELERNDKHDDEGGEAAHGRHSTESGARVKRLYEQRRGLIVFAALHSATNFSRLKPREKFSLHSGYANAMSVARRD